MDFKEFNEILEKHVLSMTKDQKYLFTTDIDGYTLWDLYLSSFPEGTNEIYIERTEHDCSCCRHFVRAFGNVVSIKNNKITSIWDLKVDDSTYQTVIDWLSAAVKKQVVNEVFVPTERRFGTKKSMDFNPDSKVTEWYHFHAVVSASVKIYPKDDVNSIRGQLRDNRNVFERSLNELTLESIDTVLELIGQKSLYKGEEWNKPLQTFRTLHKAYNKLNSNKDKANFCWTESLKAGPALSKIKNHSIGVLLTDIADGKDLNQAVKSYETIVAPSNYKRPKAIFTQKMIDSAKKEIEELGFGDS